MTDVGLLHKIVAQLAAVQNRNYELIVVHGGGKQIKHYLEELKISSHFHNGLRVTDMATMQVVQMVLAGLVNKDLVAALVRWNCRAVGLCGGDGNSFVAKKYQEDGGKSDGFDYGFVGEVFKGNPELVDLLLAKQYIPIIACVAIGEDAAYYNVNADEMASAVAVFCRAERLIFLTDVPGVFDAEKRVIPSLNRTQVEALRSAGIISAGMLPKTRACQRALENGIRQIHILGGKEPDCLTRVLLQGESLGTAMH